MGSPDPFDSTLFTSWDNVAYGGSSEVYNNMWFVPTTYTGVQDGQTQSGFKVQVTDATAPTRVRWFAYGYSETGSLSYLGGDNFNNPQAPGFEGIAAVPEPASLALLCLGVAAISRKRRKQA